MNTKFSFLVSRDLERSGFVWFYLHKFALPSYEGKFLGRFVQGKTLGNPLQKLIH